MTRHSRLTCANCVHLFALTRSLPGAWLRTTPAGAAFLAPPAERLRKAPRMSQDKMNIILYSHLSTTHGRKSARLLL